MIAGANGPYDVCKKYKDKDLRYCEEQVAACSVPVRDTNSEYPYELKICSGNRLIFGRLQTCLDSISLVIKSTGSCPTADLVDSELMCKGYKNPGKKEYCIEQARQCAEYKDKFSAETPIELQSCKKKTFKFSSLVACVNGVHSMIARDGFCSTSDPSNPALLSSILKKPLQDIKDAFDRIKGSCLNVRFDDPRKRGAHATCRANIEGFNSIEDNFHNKLDDNRELRTRSGATFIHDGFCPPLPMNESPSDIAEYYKRRFEYLERCKKDAEMFYLSDSAVSAKKTKTKADDNARLPDVPPTPSFFYPKDSAIWPEVRPMSSLAEGTTTILSGIHDSLPNGASRAISENTYKAAAEDLNGVCEFLNRELTGKPLWLYGGTPLTLTSYCTLSKTEITTRGAFNALFTSIVKYIKGVEGLHTFNPRETAPATPDKTLKTRDKFKTGDEYVNYLLGQLNTRLEVHFKGEPIQLLIEKGVIRPGERLGTTREAAFLEFYKRAMKYEESMHKNEHMRFDAVGADRWLSIELEDAIADLRPRPALPKPKPRNVFKTDDEYAMHLYAILKQSLQTHYNAKWDDIVRAINPKIDAGSKLYWAEQFDILVGSKHGDMKDAVYHLFSGHLQFEKIIHGDLHLDHKKGNRPWISDELYDVINSLKR